MQIRQNEKRVHKVVNETINGINVIAHLVADKNNADIVDTQYMTGTGFDASNVHIDVQLKRDGKTFTMISSNLAILGHFSTITMGGNSWYKGKVNVKKATGVKQQVERSVFIPFYGHHNVKGSDEIIITVNCGRDAFNDGIDKAQSSLLVTPNQSIGIETAIYSFYSYALQANMSNEQVNLGDNVQRVALVSFEQDDTKSIYKTCALTSDRLDYTITESELALKHQQFFPYNYADTLLSSGWSEKTPKYFPNTYLAHDKDEIDQAKIKVSLESANIKSSQNMVCWISFETSIQIIQKAIVMKEKHNNETLDKVPEKLT